MNSGDLYNFIGNQAAVTPSRRFFVSPEHKVLMAELTAARLTQAGLSERQAEDFDRRLKALLVETKERLGPVDPAVGFVLDDVIRLRSDIIARFEGGLGFVNAELSDLHRDAATAMFGGWSSSLSGRLVAEHIATNLVSSATRAVDMPMAAVNAAMTFMRPIWRPQRSTRRHPVRPCGRSGGSLARPDVRRTPNRSRAPCAPGCNSPA